MSDGKFKIGDYVVSTKATRVRTGTIIRGQDHQKRYLVEYDPATNDPDFGEQGLYYEDEIRLCERPSRVN